MLKPGSAYDFTEVKKWGDIFLILIKDTWYKSILDGSSRLWPTPITHSAFYGWNGKILLVVSHGIHPINKFDRYSQINSRLVCAGDKVHLYSKNWMYTVKEVSGHEVVLCTKNKEFKVHISDIKSNLTK